MIFKKYLKLWLQRWLKKKNVETTITTEPVSRVQKPPLRKQQLVIGLDFGTSFTKVVIGHERTARYAVHFGPFVSGADSHPLLLPSNLKITGADSKCQLGYPDNSCDNVQDLKIRLIERDYSEKDEHHCAAYLALILRHTRDWLLKTHEKTYRNQQIIWYVNVGVPTESYDAPVLVDVYKRIVSLAWSVSVSSNPVSLPLVRDYSKKTANHELLPEDQINVFPEFAVQLVGYITSPQRQDGLHILADVGAGTFDFTIFNVYKNKDDEDLFPIFSRSVKKLGTCFLIQHRMKNNGANTVWQPSLYERFPAALDFERHLGLNSEELRKHDKPFRECIADNMRCHLKYTKEKRVQKSKHWDEGVPTFLCGGGAKIDFYRNIFSAFEDTHPPFRIKLRASVVPDDIQPTEASTSVSEELYQRLSVAYGLSYHPLNIVEIRKQHQIDDISPEPPRIGDEGGHIGKEQV